MPLVMFSQYFKLYELEKLSGYLKGQFKLIQREHRTIFGVSKYVFTIGIQRKTRIIRYILKARVGVFADIKRAVTK